MGRLRRHLPLRPRSAGRLRPAARHLRQPRGALLHHVPAAGRDRVQPPLGRRDRHLQPVLRLLRHRPPRPGRLRAGLHRARRRRQPVRRPGHARPAERRADRTDPSCGWSAPSRSRSRPNRSPTWASRPPAGRWPGPTGTTAAGTCGCGRWTRPAWASTPSPRTSRAAFAPPGSGSWPGRYPDPAGPAGRSRGRLDHDGVSAAPPGSASSLPPEASLPGICPPANEAACTLRVRDVPRSGRGLTRTRRPMRWDHADRHNRAARTARHRPVSLSSTAHTPGA